MLLPGGLLRDGALKRRVLLREPDGELELLIAETPSRARSFHDGVGRVIAALVEEVEGEPLGYQAAQALCVADRQFLMHRATSVLGMAHQWLGTACVQCHATFELEVDFESLPVGEAGPGFPFVQVETEAGPVQLRVPTGSDQAAIGARREPAAEHDLVRRCVVDGALPEALSAVDLERIEAALDQVSPWVVTELEARCPECSARHEVPLDPYLVMRLSASQLLDEVHALAWHYHWSQAEILSLPRERRQRYLARIDRAIGLSS